MSKQTEFKEPNADGSVVVVLAHEVKLDGEQVGRVTIPSFKGKHMARLTFELGTRPSNAKLFEWCSYVIEPVGVVDEMHPIDVVAIAGRAVDMLGKSLETGDSPSE